jgi:hypothetical protein
MDVKETITLGQRLGTFTHCPCRWSLRRRVTGQNIDAVTVDPHFDSFELVIRWRGGMYENYRVEKSRCRSHPGCNTTTETIAADLTDKTSGFRFRDEGLPTQLHRASRTCAPPELF